MCFERDSPSEVSRGGGGGGALGVVDVKGQEGARDQAV